MIRSLSLLGDNGPDILAPKDVQKLLHISRSKIYELLQSGELPSTRIGSTYRIPKSWLIQYLTQDLEPDGIVCYTNLSNMKITAGTGKELL